MRILHLTVCKHLSQGQRNQLCYEQHVAGQLQPHEWTILAYALDDPQSPFEKKIPLLFKAHFMRKLYAWLILLQEHRKYDVVLMRHMTYDPFLLIFGWLVPNRVTVHHSKEIEELLVSKGYLVGKAASFLEKISGWANARQVKGLLGVTGEIARYEARTHKAPCPTGIYPNGIDLGQVDLLDDHRSSQEMHIAFVSGKFAPWHGLDRLLQAFDQESPDLPLTVHLIGRLSQAQKDAAQKLDTANVTIICHGYMALRDYRDILSICDVGLDSLALDRKGLSEAAALKVREYLAQGLPVYSAFHDTAISQGLPYFRKGSVRLRNIIGFAREMKRVSRAEIRESSARYIQKSTMMHAVCDWLEREVLASKDT
jgi:glycosyltransferase involved in cell wall biosynthesis